MSATARVRFNLLPKDYAVLAALAEEAEIELSEFCRQLAEVRAGDREREGVPTVRGPAQEVEVVAEERPWAGVSEARQRELGGPCRRAAHPEVRSSWREIEREL